MDDAMQAIEGGEAPLQGPHSARPPHEGQASNLPPHEEPSPAFIPLKLMLQPGGPILELTRPEMVMGRHSEADVRLPLPDVSRRHCRFVFTNGAWQVFDLDSLNGVLVNGKRIQHATLRDQDSLTIGSFRFTVDLSCSGSDGGNTSSGKEVIHRIADALVHSAPDIDSQRKAS